MRNLFVINSTVPEDYCFYEQVFCDAGFCFVRSQSEEDLMVCPGAVLFVKDETDHIEEHLISVCLERNIPLLLLQNHEQDNELLAYENVYDASKTEMQEWNRILHPYIPEKPEENVKVSRFLNVLMILFCLIPLSYFGWRILSMSASGTESSMKSEQQIMDMYGDAAAQVYTISSFGDTVYRGSGFAVSEDGYILTCAHVVDLPSSMYRIVYHLQVLPAEVVATDDTNDLALMKVDTSTKPLKLAPEPPDKGEQIYLIGWPENSNITLLEGTYEGTEVQTGNQFFDLISLPMYQGVSGSSVINTKGEVVGVAAAMATDDHTIGLIVSLENTSEFLKEYLFLQE